MRDSGPTRERTQMQAYTLEGMIVASAIWEHWKPTSYCSLSYLPKHLLQKKRVNAWSLPILDTIAFAYNLTIQYIVLDSSAS